MSSLEAKMMVRFEEVIVVKGIEEEIKHIRRQRCSCGGRFKSNIKWHIQVRIISIMICSLLFVVNVKGKRILYFLLMAFLGNSEVKWAYLTCLEG